MKGAIDEGCNAVDKGHDAVDKVGGTCVVDVGCEAVNVGDVFAGAVILVTSSPSTASAASPATCSSISTTLALFFESPSPLTLLMWVEIEQQATTVWLGGTKTSSRQSSLTCRGCDLREMSES